MINKKIIKEFMNTPDSEEILESLRIFINARMSKVKGSSLIKTKDLLKFLELTCIWMSIPSDNESDYVNDGKYELLLEELKELDFSIDEIRDFYFEIKEYAEELQIPGFKSINSICLFMDFFCNQLYNKLVVVNNEISKLEFS